ncbi:MAG: DUF4349 domain-containing protein [Acidobacteriia bacterium]|nr:DUF4349 domain-containing protein [Terriglobia bacterium]
MSSFSLSRILPLKSPTLWKGVALGVGIFVLALAVLIPSLTRSRGAAKISGFYSMARMAGGGGGGSEPETVQADGPKIVYKAELELRVTSCAETLKKIEALSAAESGFVESSSLEETSAQVTLRVPSARLDAVRGKLRDLAIRVRQDGLTAADVSKQYIDREAGLRNLRAQEQQFLDIMKKARTVADVLAVTKELSRVRGEIEREDAEFRRLKGQIDMAQIDVHLTSEAIAARWAPGASAKSAVNDLAQSLASLGDFLIWLVINLPLIALWAVTVFVLVAVSWYVLRRAARLMRWIFGKKASTTAAKPSA